MQDEITNPSKLLSDIKSLIGNLPSSPIEKIKEKLADLCRRIPFAALRQVSSDLRHGLRGEISAIRILQGAYEWGEVEKELVDSILKKVKGGECKEYLEILGVVGECIRYADSLFPDVVKKEGNFWETNCPHHIKSYVKGRRILFIDDHFKNHQWESCLTALFGEDNVKFIGNQQEAKEEINENGKDYGLVLLDLEMAEGKPETGMEILKLSKETHFVLPVIVFTATDKSETIKECLMEGADAYFVKELKGTNRDERLYYKKFKEMVVENLVDRDEKEIWYRIEKMEKSNVKKDPKLKSDIVLYLRQAFYFLSLKEDEFLARSLLLQGSLTPHIEKTILNCCKVIERYIRLSKNESLEDKINDVFKNEPKVKELCHYVRIKRNDAEYNSFTLSRKDAIEVFNATLQFLGNRLGIPVFEKGECLQGSITFIYKDEAVNETHIILNGIRGKIRGGVPYIDEGSPILVKVKDGNLGDLEVEFDFIAHVKWLEAYNKYPVGSVVEGMITNIENFGIFIEIEEDIRGLLYISNIREGYIYDINDIKREGFKVGDRIQVKIMEFDPKWKRISFNRKDLQPDPWLSVRGDYPVGSRHKATIRRVFAEYMFLKLNNMDAFIHRSQAKKDREWISDLRKKFKENEEINAEVIGYNDDKKSIVLKVVYT